MITTVTLNPCIDKSVTIEGFTYGGMNRIIDSRIDPSGKGINVAIAYSQLGGQALCTGINYRVNGDLVEQRLDKAGIGHDFVTVHGNISTGLSAFMKINVRGNLSPLVFVKLLF
jgi:1-phosphofructokinase